MNDDARDVLGAEPRPRDMLAMDEFIELLPPKPDVDVDPQGFDCVAEAADQLTEEPEVDVDMGC